MHILGGLLILIIAVGAIFFIGNSGVFQPLLDPLGETFGGLGSGSEGNNSEYYGQVRVEFVSLGSELDQSMLVSLGADGVQGEGILMTGWRLRTDRGTHTIPRAANLYSPSVEGVPPEDIYLREGGSVNIHSGRNPEEDQPQAIRSGFAEWHIWTGNDFLAVPHGTITLRDAEGRLVDEYEY